MQWCYQNLKENRQAQQYAHLAWLCQTLRWMSSSCSTLFSCRSSIWSFHFSKHRFLSNETLKIIVVFFFFFFFFSVVCILRARSRMLMLVKRLLTGDSSSLAYWDNTLDTLKYKEMSLHKTAFEAVIVITQLDIVSGNQPFQVRFH